MKVIDEELYYQNAQDSEFDEFNEINDEENEKHFLEIIMQSDFDECESDLDKATKTAQKAFGVNFLFPWQRLVISNILDAFENICVDKTFSQNFDDDEICRGRQIVLLPTGAGKSMCFLVPSLILPGATIVFYPLLALMADQKRRMDEGGISCVLLKGGQTQDEREEIFSKIEKNEVKVILANPEVLQNEKLVKRLSKCNISHVAIDEAHCIAEWGDSFRPAYLTIGKIIKTLNVKIVTAFTATASPVILSRIGEVLFENHFHLLKGESDRKNIHYSVKYAYAKEKAVLQLAKKMRRPLIVFCGTRSRTENMARLLSEYFGREKVRFYHAGMTKDEKNTVEKWFFDSGDGLLTATCAYGMGMDKGNIYSVIHLDAPNHLENFCQEAGRAGRKGDDVHSVLVWNHTDFIRYKRSEIKSRERAIGDFVFEKDCRRQFMLDYLGGEKTVCSGCDLCDAKKNDTKIDYKSEDAEIVVDFVRKNRKIFSKKELTEELKKIFNERTIKIFKMNIWEDKDITSILSQLLSEKRIKSCFGLWNGKIDICDEKKIDSRIIKKIKSTFMKSQNRRHFILQLLHLLYFLRFYFRYFRQVLKNLL